ncbi:MAG TPA: hypothetical protein VF761_03720 [Gemmatimonadaceae bacterium]
MRITPLAVALFATSVTAPGLRAQTHDHPAAAASTAVVPSAEAKQAFALIKSLAGRWQASFTLPGTQKTVDMQTWIRVTSSGNSVVHEMKGAGDADETPKDDHPVTMIYLEGADLVLTHYCDAGNRPRMVAHLSPDGKQVDFDFIDLSGPTNRGHMQHARFTVVDSTHHIEEWTYLMPNGQARSFPLNLQRVETVASLPAK